MLIELRNLKTLAALSEETNCFSATVYVDGKRAGTASNEGHGGPTTIDPIDLKRRLDAHGAALPRIVSAIQDETDPSGFFSYTQTAETIIDDLVERSLLERTLRNLLAKHVVFTVAGRAGIYQTKAMKAADLARSLSVGKFRFEGAGADKILNLLPISEAIEIYKAHA